MKSCLRGLSEFISKISVFFLLSLLTACSGRNIDSAVLNSCHAGENCPLPQEELLPVAEAIAYASLDLVRSDFVHDRHELDLYTSPSVSEKNSSEIHYGIERLYADSSGVVSVLRESTAELVAVGVWERFPDRSISVSLDLKLPDYPQLKISARFNHIEAKYLYGRFSPMDAFVLWSEHFSFEKVYMDFRKSDLREVPVSQDNPTDADYRNTLFPVPAPSRYFGVPARLAGDDLFKIEVLDGEEKSPGVYAGTLHYRRSSQPLEERTAEWQIKDGP